MMEGDDKAKAEEEIAAKVAGGASKPAAAAAAGGDDYPPKGLSAGVKKLEEWIQVGCGDKPYHCEEKKATFPSDKCPDKLPDLSEHSNCMTDFFKKNPEVYDTLKDKVTTCSRRSRRHEGRSLWPSGGRAGDKRDLSEA